MDPILAHDVTEEGSTCDPKQALSLVKTETQSTVQMISSRPIHRKVIEKDLHERMDKIVKNLRNSALERGESCLKFEHHD